MRNVPIRIPIYTNIDAIIDYPAKFDVHPASRHPGKNQDRSTINLWLGLVPCGARLFSASRSTDLPVNVARSRSKDTALVFPRRAVESRSPPRLAALFNSRGAELLDAQRLVRQLVGLERRISRGGRDFNRPRPWCSRRYRQYLLRRAAPGRRQTRDHCASRCVAPLRNAALRLGVAPLWSSARY